VSLRRSMFSWMNARVAAIAAIIFGVWITPAAALEKVIFLLPAPPSLPAFAPLIIAKQLGYYSRAGYDVQFITAQGGIDAAKQVGVGNADLGMSVGGAPIIVRANGVPIKDVAIVGGGGLAVLVARQDHGVKTFSDLRGKKVAVMSYQEANYYDFLGALAAKGINKSDLRIEAVGPGGVVSLVVAGAVDACVCTPDWEVDVKNAVPNTVSMPLTRFIPTMAQAIIASDDGIAKHPKRIRAVVQASLQGMKYVMDDPQKAADAYIAALPAFQGKKQLMTQILADYVKRTYQGQKTIGAIDPATMAALQKLYMAEGIVRVSQPVDSFFTNQFVQ
jgi:NitT/TauT family transport system substrate-binding protein